MTAPSTLPTDREIEDGEIARYERLLRNAADNLQASQSLLSLALGALEPFGKVADKIDAGGKNPLADNWPIPTRLGNFRQASQVIAQIKRGQESMASSARSEPK